MEVDERVPLAAQSLIPVEAFGGRYDAVIAAEEIEGPAVGAVVQLGSWLIGSFENG